VKQSEINQAQGQAQAILSIAEAISSPGGMNAVNLKVAEQDVAAFGNLAKTGNTLIVPSNIADLGTLVTSATTMFKAQ
jgi:SPFH domain/Band 7 family protein